MAEGPTVLAICGSLREASRSRIAAEIALEGVESAGGTGEMLDVREYDLPVFDPDVSLKKAGDAETVTRRVEAADALILATPMYHGSYSSPLKTVLDYCGFDEFEHKTIGLLAVSGGHFPITALDHLRSVCRALDAWVLPYQAAVPRSSSAISEGTFQDDKLEERVETLGKRVVEYANIHPDPASFESEENVGASN